MSRSIPPPLIEQKRLAEIIHEAAARPTRLTTWEQAFMRSMQDSLRRNGLDAASVVTARQLAVLVTIERKLFGVG
jgi:hypothetical protein